ncbi:hypothetical protein AeMF1_015768 [Aphanomyces euteiches]|nr:hypothetical protein AeMF1_015768 [Aphanomyces euteiches]KAH9197081.1 hypothetical protein AeNC1_000936 [Aphanomyces euteiches]
MSTVAKSRNKERAKENRRLRKEELDYLRSRVTELSRQLHAETKMLPWQEVAHALQSESSTAQETNRALRRDIIRTTVLLECLLALVAGPMARSPETSPFVQASGWKNQAILGIDGEARVASFQWLLSRLFHNTGMAYAQCPNTPSVRIDVNYDDHYISGCRGAQYIVPAPMDQAVRTLDGLIKCDIFFDRDNPTYLYDQELLQTPNFGPSTFHFGPGNGPTYLRGSQVSPSQKRAVFARCRVNFDAARPGIDQKEQIHHAWSEKLVVEPLSESTSRLLSLDLIAIPTTISSEECAHLLVEKLETVNAWTEPERLDALVTCIYNHCVNQEQQASNVFFKWLPFFVEPNEDQWKKVLQQISPSNGA